MVYGLELQSDSGLAPTLHSAKKGKGLGVAGSQIHLTCIFLNIYTLASPLLRYGLEKYAFKAMV